MSKPPRKKFRFFNNFPKGPAPNTINLNSASEFSSEDSHISVDWSRNKKSPVGWRLYFPETPFDENSDYISRMQAALKHFKSHPDLYDAHTCRKNMNLHISLPTLLSDDLFLQGWPNFEYRLVEDPTQVLAIVGLAIYQLATNRGKDCTPQAILPRLFGLKPIVGIRDLEVANSHKLLTIRGTVTRVDTAKLRTTWMQFDCGSCGSSQLVRQPEGKYTMPRICLSKTCKAKSDFVIRLSHHFSETVQTIRVQEMMSAISDSSPLQQTAFTLRFIDVELKQDLVDSNEPGDDVTVTAILRVRKDERGGTYNKAAATNYQVYLEAVSVVTNTNKKTQCSDEPTDKDRMFFKTIEQEQKGVFRLLVHSLCPRIYGNDMIKAGLLLGMFGGDSKTPGGRRTQIHVLIVGDPGLGKSVMLQACVSAAPRGIFVSGCTSTVAGLTVAVRVEKGKGTSLEAGALVLADQGICCIDEFDKLATKNSALLEAMETQKISVTKANIAKTVNARTTILAAGNPIGGHYNKCKTVAENLKLNPALLSRFDLVFIMLDRPNVEHDMNVAKHMKAFYEASANRVVSTSSTTQVQGLASRWFEASTPSSSLPNMSLMAEQNLMEHLRLRPGEKIDNVPHVLMQKYILYARKTCHPKLTKEAQQVIEEFYLEIRQKPIGPNVLPVTVRQLEALCRLTIARARIEMSSQATLEHANDVLALVRHSMVDVFSTDTGALHLGRKSNGAGLSATTQVRKFAELLQEQARLTNKRLFTENEMAELATNWGFTRSATTLIDSLNVQGVLLHKGSNFYKLI